jgi:hypothetical protein
MKIKCDYCAIEFNRKPSQVNKRKQHFCSRNCQHKGKILSEETRLKMSEGAKSLKGIKRSEEFKKRLSLTRSGVNSPMWKGNRVGYKSLHAWISRNWGKQKLCEVCGTTNAIKFEWANLNGIYDRDRLNWKRMCCSCHSKYDNKIKNINNNYEKTRQTKKTVEEVSEY